MATDPPEGFTRRPLVLHDEPAGARWIRLYRRAFPDPLGFGTAPSRFSPPPEATDRYGVVYLGSSVKVTLAETLVRDRGDGRLGDLPVELAELEAWACADIEVVSPLRLADLRGDGPLRMGVPSDVAHASDWRLSQVWSAALHAHDLRPDGLIYLSRFTGEPNLAVFERALSKLAAVRVGALLDRRAELAAAIRRLGLQIV
ncbi:RES family NAD+ phosphorylase [Phenylobacterium sp.]|uniref:RES family NAD+ phosphorylase n=1 Tax=Phenylobacterium sp. TaxID=1871053 RepID=UPI0035C7F7A1